MLYYEIIGLLSLQSLSHIIQPLVGKVLIHRIHYGDLIILYHI